MSVKTLIIVIYGGGAYRICSQLNLSVLMSPLPLGYCLYHSGRHNSFPDDSNGETLVKPLLRKV